LNRSKGSDLFAASVDASTSSASAMTSFIPEPLQPYIATALLLRQGGALALWPFLNSPAKV
ncbi:MAG: hypothetical protein AAFS10_00300, partial [Myxococcota bacterium]